MDKVMSHIHHQKAKISRMDEYFNNAWHATLTHNQYPVFLTHSFAFRCV